MKKSLIIICLIACVLFSISSVAAGDVNETTIATEDTQQTMEVTNEDVNGEVVTPTGSFTALQGRINNAEEGSTVILTTDYVNVDEFRDGINISKSITIDGKGHTVNAGSQSKIFSLNADNIVLKNIRFKDASARSDGGAIHNTGSNCKIISCDFIDCKVLVGEPIYDEFFKEYEDGLASMGGAIYNKGDNFTVSKCNFTRCSAEAVEDISFLGGAIYNTGNKFTLSNCIFNNCKCGTICNEGADCNIISSTFNERYGRAVYNEGTNCNIISSKFNGGGILNYNGNGLNIKSCAFSKCSDETGGAIYNHDGNNLNIQSCTFSMCSATEDGGAIYNYYGNNLNIKSCTFSKCSSKSFGGAVYNECYHYHKEANCIISSCDFLYCADGDGVAINAEEYKCIAKNCKFTNSKKTAGYETKFIKCTFGYLSPKIKIILPTVKVKKSAKKLIIKATLKINDKPAKNKKMTFKFNGKTYKSTTNKKGVAEITIKSNVLKKLKVGKKVIYQATYLKNTVKKSIKVIK